MNATETIQKIEEKIPLHLQLSFDHSGIQCGPFPGEVGKIGLCLDFTPAVVRDAARQGCQLLVAHHPLLFDGIHHVDFSTGKGEMLRLAMENQITLYATHTPMDIVPGGLNDYWARELGLSAIRPLQITGKRNWVKIQFFGPLSHRDQVLEAIALGGGGKWGNYSDCTFSVQGIGSFKPLDQANPYLGEKGKRAYVEEFRIESILPEDQVDHLVSIVKQVHPYEEVAYDILPNKSLGEAWGVGRVGVLAQPRAVEEIAQHVGKLCGDPFVQMVLPPKREVSSLAICTGSGKDFLHSLPRDTELYITSDLGYHDLQWAREQSLSILNISHSGSEGMFSRVFRAFFPEWQERFSEFHDPIFQYWPVTTQRR
ncbi:MAG TPA: Nif3-like dinuclear metal center hexameric protein [Thermotogota bacterium]|nr:Nif3-like dinuclear metal center hexameric protein [Thermotogota bacterium]